MCSIGHDVDEHPRDRMVRVPRRHLDDTFRRAVRAMPRAELLAAKASLTARLRADVEAEQADALAQQHGHAPAQLELVGAGGGGDDYMHTPQAAPQGWWNRDDR